MGILFFKNTQERLLKLITAESFMHATYLCIFASHYAQVGEGGSWREERLEDNKVRRHAKERTKIQTSLFPVMA